MCGIAGIIGRQDDANRAALARMSKAMTHRGPDDAGTWESPADARGRGVLLAHRRLSILDLSPAGAQPMVDRATGDVLSYNGELYNYLELREALGPEGADLPSTGDTAVLLRVLARQGPEALPSLRGMFALAFWNASKRSLLLARDPMGIKPLYLARSQDPGAGWTVAFASELRALLQSGLLGTPRLDPAAVASVVWNGFVVGPTTAVSSVKLLDPGTMVLLDADGGETRSRRFQSIARRPEGLPTDENALAAELEKSVRLHLASDVPLAVFLSSGVDSSAVANLARQSHQGPVSTFTLAFEEQELNEGPFARRIAGAIGTEHREVVLTESNFLEGIERALDSLDQPSFDGINAYFMSRSIREAGFTVALVGTGGDELFGGYPTFRELPTLQMWSRRLGFVPRGALVASAVLAARALQRRSSAMPPQTRWAKLPHMVRSGDNLKALYQLAYALFLPDFQASLLSPSLQGALIDGLTPQMSDMLDQETSGRSPRSAISVMETRLFLGERLLRDNDSTSMASSIEQRLPLVDSQLFDTVDRLPDGVRFDPIGKKALLRRVGLRGLDLALFERPKRGFVLPFQRWLRQGMRQEMDATLSDPQAVSAVGLDPASVARLWGAFKTGAPGLYWSRIWALYVLIRWANRHGVRL